MKKQICFISPKFSDHIGGMETHAYEFAKAFTKDQEYTLNGILIKNMITDGVPAPCREEQDGVHDDKNGKSKTLKLDDLIKTKLTGNFVIDAETIMQQVEIENTIFYLNSPTWLPSMVLIKKTRPDTKVIVRSGGNDIMAGWIGDENEITTSLEDNRKELVNMINKYADLLIVNSNFSYNRNLSVGILPEKMIKIIGGVDCQEFYPELNKPNDGKIRILTSARLVKFKGFEYSINAVKELINRGIKNIEYNIVGNGPEKENIQKLISTNNLSEYVNLVGSKRIEDMPEQYRRADIFLHMPILLEKFERGSSYIHTETMGRCICEALASGLPIIASAIGGIPELISNNTVGYLVPERNYFAAADKISELIRDVEVRKKMSVAGRERAQTLYDWQIIFNEYKKLFA